MPSIELSPAFTLVVALIMAAGPIGAAIIGVRAKKLKDLLRRLEEVAGITDTSGSLTKQNERNLDVLREDLGMSDAEKKRVPHLTKQHDEIKKAIENIETRFVEQDTAKNYLSQSDPRIVEVLERVGQMAVPLAAVLQENAKLHKQIQELTAERDELREQINEYQIDNTVITHQEEQHHNNDLELDIPF